MTLVICEKPSQAKQVSAAVGTKYGRVMALAGHVVRIAEPEEVEERWGGGWNTDLLWNGVLFPFRKPKDERRAAILSQVGAALKGENHVIIATDPDREGQLLGQEVLEFYGFKGKVSRVHFLGVDKNTISKAFDNMRPNEDFIGQYESGMCRMQCDQIANLTLTRTSSKALLGPNVSRGNYISIGRVRTPVLAMIARREKEIIDFKPQDYFEVNAHVEADDGRKVTLTCTGLPKGAKIGDDEPEEEEEDNSDAAQILEDDSQSLDGKIARKDIALALAASVKGQMKAIVVKAGQKKTAPPKLFDMAALQAAAGLRFKTKPDDTMKIAQSLYDKGILTYPRGESTQMPEAAILESHPLLEMLVTIPSYARHANLLAEPVIRKGKTGVYWDGIAEKYSHFAIVPNFANCDQIPGLLADCDEAEKRMFDLVARRFMAAHAPDYLYDQTVYSFEHAWAPEGRDPIRWRFFKTGNVPVQPGWKEIEFPNGDWKSSDKEPTMDPFRNGEQAPVKDSSVITKTTKAPSRFLVSAIPTLMQQVWRTLPKEQAQYKAKLKEVEGIGRPGTRDKVVMELIKVGQIGIDKERVFPTPGGMRLWETLTEIAPNIVDPVRTAVWETLFSKVEKREMAMMDVIEKVASSTNAERLRIIEAGKGINIEIGKKKKPEAKYMEWAERLAKEKGIEIPKEVRESDRACYAFITEHRPKDAEGNPLKAGENKPSEKQVTLARGLADSTGLRITAEHLATSGALSKFIDEAMKIAPPSEAQLNFARKIAGEKGIEIPEKVLKSKVECSAFIDKHASGGKSGGKSAPAKGGARNARSSGGYKRK